MWGVDRTAFAGSRQVARRPCHLNRAQGHGKRASTAPAYNPLLPATLTEASPETVAALVPRWHVVLLDDDEHTYAYVVEMLGSVFGHARPKAFRMAEEVDASGRVIVWTGPRETAEFKQERVHGYGSDPRIAACKGSMSAVLEPA